MYSCPLCNGRQADEVLDLRYLKRDALLLPGTVYKCSACRTLFKHTQFAAHEVYNSTYAEQALRTPRVQNGGLALFAAEQLNHTEGARLLDIGAGSGAFMRELNKRGWITEGLEINEVFCQQGSKNGLVLHCKAIEEFSAWHLYSHFTMLDVIEHLEHPVAALQKISAGAPVGSTLVVLTPNHNSLLVRVSLLLYKVGVKSIAEEVFGCTHLVFFTPATLESAMQKGGWKIKKQIHQRYRATDAGANNPAVASILAEWIDWLGSVLGFGNYRMLVVAQNIC